MSQPIKIVAVLTALPGKAADLRALIDTMLAPSRAEPGNLRYDLWQDRADPARFVIDELYVDEAAIAAHRDSAHFRAFAAASAALTERDVLLLDPIDVA
jgi:quinol monooxygenase YgiN